jgi:hypothetical protein
MKMKIDTDAVFPALKLYRERKLDLSGNDSEQRSYVESEVKDMQNVVRNMEQIVRRFEVSGLYVDGGAKR